jgi:hypothetical protein
MRKFSLLTKPVKRNKVSVVVPVIVAAAVAMIATVVVDHGKNIFYV